MISAASPPLAPTKSAGGNTRPACSSPWSISWTRKKAPAVDRPRPDRQDLPGLFLKKAGRVRTAAVYLQRHVETVSGRYCKKSAAGAVNVLDDRVSYHESHGQGHRRGQGGRVPLKNKGKEPLLTKSRWCLLKRPENLTEKQCGPADGPARMQPVNRPSLPAQGGWSDSDLQFAGLGRQVPRCLVHTNHALQDRLLFFFKPMKKVAKMLRAHRALLLNWFRAKGAIALGCVEGFNNKAKVVTKRSYGFRTYDGLKIALYHALGDLPTGGYPQILLRNPSFLLVWPHLHSHP